MQVASCNQHKYQGKKGKKQVQETDHAVFDGDMNYVQEEREAEYHQDKGNTIKNLVV